MLLRTLAYRLNLLCLRKLGLMITAARLTLVECLTLTSLISSGSSIESRARLLLL